MASSYSYLFKFIIIGDTGVGKSCLLLKYIDGRFRQKHQVTIGVEFGAKVVTVNEVNIKVQVWDTAGQESFKSITRGYYRSAAVALLVYDITNRQSFENVAKWLEEAKANGNSTLSFVLVGNKCDLDSERVVKAEEGKKMAEENRMMFFETSSKEGMNVKEVFEKGAQIVLQKVDSQQIDPNNPNSGVKLGNKFRTKALRLNEGQTEPSQRHCQC